MFNSFSERHGIIKRKMRELDELPPEARNRFWNSVSQNFKKLKDEDRNLFIEHLLDNFFKQCVDDYYIPSSFTSVHFRLESIKKKFYELKWDRVYDFLAIVVTLLDSEKKLTAELNFIFEDEGLQYRIIESMVTPLMSKLEAEEIEKALKPNENKYHAANKHLEKALNFYQKRPDPDYLNSIKECISAIESLALDKANSISKSSKDKSKLTHLVSDLNIHPALQEAIIKLYGWTSDQGGIRHCHKSETNKNKLEAGASEARFMIIICSAFKNYIVSKE